MPQKPYSMKKKLLYVIVPVAAVAAAVLVRLFPPGKYKFWPPCIFHDLTGIYCPGCGNTRALSALMHGDVAGCFAKNAIFVPLLCCLLAIMIRPKLARNPYFSWGVAAVVTAFFILRNLPWYPFTLLAPH